MARPKKEPKKKYIRQNISMDPEQLERLIKFCQQQDRAISWVIRQALDKYLESEPYITEKVWETIKVETCNAVIVDNKMKK